MHPSATYLPLQPAEGEVSAYAEAMHAAGADASEAEMIAHMERAAEEGDGRALYALATWHLHGLRGYDAAPARAMPLLRRSADAGVREAMFDLAVSYDSGIGTEEDPREAYLWYLRAAIRADRDAISVVANYTAVGRGVAVDDHVALVWYELAESLGVDVEDAAAYRRWLAADER